MNKNKRGQSEIITTVLIILLVLAAIVIVWQVVKSTVTSGTGQVESQSNCIGMSLTVTDVTSTATSITNVKIKRGADSIADTSFTSMKILVTKSDGSSACTISDITTGLPKALEELSYTVTCTDLTTATDYTVKVAPKIGGQQCDISSTLVERTP